MNHLKTIVCKDIIRQYKNDCKYIYANITCGIQKNIDKMTVQELIELLKNLNNLRRSSNSCYKLREKYKKNCVLKSDPGHDYAIYKAKQYSDFCLSQINLIYKRYDKLKIELEEINDLIKKVQSFDTSIDDVSVKQIDTDNDNDNDNDSNLSESDSKSKSESDDYQKS